MTLVDLYLPNPDARVHLCAHTWPGPSDRVAGEAGALPGSLARASVALCGPPLHPRQGTHASDEKRVAGDPLHGLQQEAGQGHPLTARVRSQLLQRMERLMSKCTFEENKGSIDCTPDVEHFVDS